MADVPCYAGIGSRRAPIEVLELCSQIAVKFRRNGWWLRTGHAIGCDQAFEDGASAQAEVFLPWKDFEADHPIRGATFILPTIPALNMVSRFHPAPGRLSMASLRLHARNCHIILGRCLNDPASHVVCWTPDEDRSGTALGIRVAREYGIPVHNLFDPQVRARWEAW